MPFEPHSVASVLPPCQMAEQALKRLEVAAVGVKYTAILHAVSNDGNHVRSPSSHWNVNLYPRL